MMTEQVGSPKCTSVLLLLAIFYVLYQKDFFNNDENTSGAPRGQNEWSSHVLFTNVHSCLLWNSVAEIKSREGMSK